MFQYQESSMKMSAGTGLQSGSFTGISPVSGNTGPSVIPAGKPAMLFCFFQFIHFPEHGPEGIPGCIIRITGMNCFFGSFCQVPVKSVNK